jgi:two-component system, LuxR family, sensor kinase FixL
VKKRLRQRAAAAAGVLTDAFGRRWRPGGMNFRRTFEQCPVGLAVVGLDQRVLKANPALCAMLGCRDGVPRGRALWDLAHPNDLDSVQAELQRFLSLRSERLDLEMRCRKESEEWFWAEITMAVVRDDEGRAVEFVAAVEDIDSRRKMEESLRRSNADLSLYASIASHDLQEPVRKVITYGQVLAKSSALLPAEARTALAKIQRASARMKELIEDLLEYSRVSSQELSVAPVDLNVILREVLLDLDEEIAASRARITTGRLPEIEAGALQMRLLFQNLISNALKFVQDGERPEIEVSAEALDPARIAIEVKDHGIGFDEKYLSRIFKPFQRLCDTSVYEGSGIGLAICKAVIERHGGSISAFSAPGKGARFRVVLPVHPRKPS